MAYRRTSKGDASNDLNVYNLEFEAYCHNFDLFGYEFRRVRNYKDQLQKLFHDVSCTHEFSIERNTGQHAITGTVTLPAREKRAVLPWKDKKTPALSDVLLVLSIFTGRE